MLIPKKYILKMTNTNWSFIAYRSTPQEKNILSLIARLTKKKKTQNDKPATPELITGKYT